MSGDFVFEPSYALGASVLVLLLTLGVQSYNNSFGYLKKRNIKHPIPLPIIGNVLPMFISDAAKTRWNWREKYGKVYGYYWNKKARLCISDPEVLHQICVKEFETFTNHDLSIFKNKYQDNFLTNLKDDDWRRVRALMSPTFTSGKIKRMFGLLEGCAHNLVSDLMNSSNKPTNLKELAELYAFNTMSICCYGFKPLSTTEVDDEQTRNQREQFVEDCRRASKLNVLRALLYFTVPGFVLDLFSFELHPDTYFKDLAIRAEKVVEIRKNSQIKPNDYLQSLIDSELGHNLDDDDEQDLEAHHANEDSRSTLRNQKDLVDRVRSLSKKIKLSKDEVLSGAILFLAVGIHTTGNLITSVLYSLAYHPEIQAKLRSEIRKSTNGDITKITYDNITSSNYLDCIISETLRLFTPVIAIDRLTGCEGTHLKKYDITIEKGIVVDLDFYSIMRDPSYWPNPETFDPERFSTENRAKIVPFSYCPFGIGPRHCLGMRFALTTAKMAVAKAVHDLVFEPANSSSFPPKMTGNMAMMWIKNPIVKVRKFVP